MSKPRYKWWSYVKGMIRDYPKHKAEFAELHKTKTTASYSCEPKGNDFTRPLEDTAIRELPHNKQREYEAVRRAIEQTEHMINARDRLYVIDLVLWRRSHTVQGAGLLIPVCERTAKQWHREFITLVASNYGLMD